ncbi:hypothetical protein [Candidatus Williamhamiltonella defendens]|nr:hypothetical protein [Candidatus Hamiltonella defensa]
MVFTSPKIAEVSEKDIFQAIKETLKQKYPENRFLGLGMPYG